MINVTAAMKTTGNRTICGLETCQDSEYVTYNDNCLITTGGTETVVFYILKTKITEIFVKHIIC